MVSLATAIGEETERLKAEEMEKSGERTLNSAGGGKSKCRDKSWRRKSCNGLWWEILGLKVSKRNSWGPKTDKKKRRKNAGQRLRRAWFFNRGEKRAVTDWGEERKLREGQISNVSLGPSYIGLYHRCWAGPIRYGLCGALCNFVSGTSPDSFPDGAKRPNNSSKWG